jgi:hypothetical protein
MTKEALKLALEALEYRGVGSWRKKQPAITAIKQVLANEALEKKAENARELGLDYEPVIDKSAAVRIATALGWKPQRTWVGLTKKEFQEAVEGFEDLEDCWVAIEAKLKEKNT